MSLDRKDYKSAIPQLDKRLEAVESIGKKGLANFDILQSLIEKEILERQRQDAITDTSINTITVKMYYLLCDVGVTPTPETQGWSETMPKIDYSNDNQVLWYMTKTFRNGAVIETSAPQQVQLMDGVFAFINSVADADNNWTTIDGGKISTGRIQDNINGNNYFDLDSGEFNFQDSNGNYVRQNGNGIQIQGTLSLSSAVGSGTLNDIVDDMADFAQDVIDINGDIQDLQSQIDGNITTWFYGYAPTLSNAPASSWTTTTDKDNHLGDLFYNTTTGYAYRFMYENGTYSWGQITDQDVTEALRLAGEAQDTADHKRRVFVSTPVPPYDIGDLWAEGSSGDIKKCKTAKADGQSYSASDWELASKYTDDTAVTNFASRFSVTPEAISSEVTATQDGNTLTTRINQNATTVKIQASKVQVDGTLIVGASDVDNAISNTSVGDLSDGSNYSTTSQMTTAINNAKQIKTDTASGSIATFTGSKYPAVEVVAQIEPIQSGSGTPSPSNIRPFTGWTECEVDVSGVNVWDEEWETGVYDASGAKANNSNRIRSKNKITVKANTTYTIVKPTGYVFAVCEYDATQTFIKRVFTTASQQASSSYQYTTNTNTAYLTFYVGDNTLPISVYGNDISINYPSTDTTYHAYNGATYTTQLGQTVYGGTLDVTSGTLTVNRAMTTIGTLTVGKTNDYFYMTISAKKAGNTNLISDYYATSASGTVAGMADGEIKGNASNQYVYIKDSNYTDATAFKNARANVEIVYELATPQTYQLTPQQIECLQGTNNLWATSGNVNVKYAVISADAVEALNNPIDNSSKVATSYITQIDDGGIKVHDAGDTSNYAQLNSDGMKVFKNSTEMASFGSDVRIGKPTSNNTGNVYIDDDSIDIRKGSTVLSTFTANGAEFGKNSDSATIDFCDSKSRISVVNGASTISSKKDLQIRTYDYDWYTPSQYGTEGLLHLDVTNNGSMYWYTFAESDWGVSSEWGDYPDHFMYPKIGAWGTWYDNLNDADILCPKVWIGTGSSALWHGLYSEPHYNGDGSNALQDWIICVDANKNIRIPKAYTDTTSSSANLNIASGGVLARSTSSSKRYKKDIKDIENEELDPNRLYDARVVQFKYRDDYLAETDQRFNKDVVGFIVEELENVYPIAIDYVDEQPEDWSARYLIPPMLKLIQEQKKEIDELKSIVAELAKEKKC